MTILVRTPPGYDAERDHVLDVVLARWWGLSWRRVAEDRADVRLELDGEPGGVTVPEVLFATPPQRWLTADSLPDPGRARRRVGRAGAGVLGVDERLPVVYGPDADDADLVLVDGAEATVGLDVLGTVFFALTRYEEHVSDRRDHLDRFPSRESLAGRDGFLGLPVADACVELLWAASTRIWPRLARRPSTYAVSITHDIDDPLASLGPGPAGQARRFAGDLVRRRDPGLLARRARALAAARRGNHEPDPNNTFDLLMDVSERHGLRSAFYFLDHAEPPAHRLLDHPWVRALVGRVHRRGHEVGLHTTIGTYRDPARIAAELDAWRRVAAEQGVEQARWGGRQHYLQWAPETWRHWAAAGLDYDCTLAFPDAVGFRTGTCRPYPAFDVVGRRPLTLVEEPFQVMDVTLTRYLGLGPEAAWDATLAIARECRRFGGTVGLLWHNDSVLRTRREQRWYAALIEALVAPGSQS